ncbi:MAG: metallophosphoesterase [Candidatus Riflebacteria bacterium]|nr:metallophosphoesterase [Candidatus Riflebacteria bacterium]
MKILIFTDNHFCEKASIITKMGKFYSLRLENQIESINWVERLAEKEGCNMVICAGDFFDKPSLTPDEITALQDISWADIEHYFLVGNHESDEADLRYSSTKALEQPGFEVVNKPKVIHFYKTNFELCFLPYVVERDRQPVSSYFPKQVCEYRLLISHNDLFGIQMGPTVSAVGFKPEDLEANCNLCINGHLHNAPKATDKVINLVNLTGKDFGEDASKIPHGVVIFDTDTCTYKFVENPHAFNFYKLEINKQADLNRLANLKNNAIISVHCKDTLVAELRKLVATLPNIAESRIIITREIADGETVEDITDLTVDQYVKFAECCREKLENTPILEAELAEILK